MSVNKKYLISGLGISYKIAGEGYNYQQLSINPGSIKIFQPFGNWSAESYYEITEITNIDFSATTGQYPNIKALYAKPELNTMTGKKYLSFVFKDSSIAENTIYPNLPEDDADNILLSLIFIPSAFPSISKRLSFINVNNSDVYPSLGHNIDTFLAERIKKIEEWSEYTFYVQNQIVRETNGLWLCKNNHQSTSSFQNDKYKTNWWQQISGGGSSYGSAGSSGLVLSEIFEEVIEGDYTVTYLKSPNQSDILPRAISSRLTIV